jgi:hypothetical protein
MAFRYGQGVLLVNHAIKHFSVYVTQAEHFFLRQTFPHELLFYLHDFIVRDVFEVILESLPYVGGVFTFVQFRMSLRSVSLRVAALLSINSLIVWCV